MRRCPTGSCGASPGPGRGRAGGRPRAAIARTGRPKMRSAMRPAASPARAGTAAISGSAPARSVVLLAPRTPRSRSRIAPPMARPMTTSSKTIRARTAPAARTTSPRQPDGPLRGRDDRGRQQQDRQAGDRQRDRDRREVEADRDKREGESHGRQRRRQRDEQALGDRRPDHLERGRAARPRQAEGRPAPAGAEQDDEAEGRSGDHRRTDRDGRQHGLGRAPARLLGVDEPEQPAAQGGAAGRAGRGCGRREHALEPAQVGQQVVDPFALEAGRDRPGTATCSGAAARARRSPTSGSGTPPGPGRRSRW